MSPGWPHVCTTSLSQAPLYLRELSFCLDSSSEQVSSPLRTSLARIQIRDMKQEKK